jgi:branched-chain amino acid transport system substrate-binding protein
VASAADKWNDPKNFPWTMGWMPSSWGEALVYAKYVLQNHPTAKIAVLFQNDDFGKDYLVGLREGLGEKAGQMIILEVPYEVTSPTIDSQLVQIKAANPDIFLNFSSAKVAAQSIRKMAELGWKPIHILSAASTPIEGVIRPAGFDNAQGILSVQYMKSAKDPQWNDDPGMKEWIVFMNEYFAEGNKDDSQTIWGYGVAKAVVQVLIQCGDELTRANVMKQAANLDFYNGVTLPGIRIKTSPTNFRPINQFQMMRFKDGSWQGFGPLLGAD